MNNKKIQKIFKNIYLFLWIVIIPCVIGGGVQDFLIDVYNNFGGHWVAYIFVCFLTALVASYFSGIYYLINAIYSFEIENMSLIFLLSSASEIICLIIFGINSIGYFLTPILICNATITTALLIERIKNIKNQG